MAKKIVESLDKEGNIVELKGINISHQSNIVLKDVNFKVKKGDFVYLIGKVGSGKSSLLKTLYGELPAKGGTAFTVGYNLGKLKKNQVPYLRRKMGIVFQDFQLLSDRSVYDNLMFVLRATGWKHKKEMDKKIRDILSLVDMVHKGYKKPHQLSGGEQQRIAIARALLNDPELLLADEPTGNLDPETTISLMELLNKISESGQTIIMATHNMTIIEQYKGRVVKCEDTRLTEETVEVAETPTHPIQNEAAQETEEESNTIDQPQKDTDPTAEADSPESIL